MSEESKEIAKAVSSVARLGEKSLDSAEKLGGFFAKVFNDAIEEIAGMVTDKLRFIRWNRLIKISDEVNSILELRGIEKTRPVPPKLALPIFEDGSLEEDETLQKLWSRLLANAMDPTYNNELRYGFIDMIKNITGIEVLILNFIYSVLKENNLISNINEITNYYFPKEAIMKHINIDLTKYQICIYNLMRMQCIAPAIIKIKGIKMNNEDTTIHKGTDAVILTPLGLKFVEACIYDR